MQCSARISARQRQHFVVPTGALVDNGDSIVVVIAGGAVVANVVEAESLKSMSSYIKHLAKRQSLVR